MGDKLKIVRGVEYVLQCRKKVSLMQNRLVMGANKRLAVAHTLRAMSQMVPHISRDRLSFGPPLLIPPPSQSSVGTFFSPLGAPPVRVGAPPLASATDEAAASMEVSPIGPTKPVGLTDHPQEEDASVPQEPDTPTGSPSQRALIPESAPLPEELAPVLSYAEHPAKRYVSPPPD